MSSVVVERETIAVSPRLRPRVTRKSLAFSCLGLAVGLAAAWFGHDWFTVGRFIESTDDAYVGGDITVIAPKVSGFVQQVVVTDNQAVKAGDLLVKIDDRDYRAALAKADAAVEAQRATIANLEATRDLQLSIIKQARAGVEASDAEVTRAHDDQVRFKDLSSHAAASIQAFQK